MTDEEKAIANICKECSSYDFCIKNNQLHCAETVAYLKGLTEGRKEICEICEKNMIEGNSNINGCAYRKLGNEYCWEMQNE